MEQDINQNRKVESRFYYTDSVIRLKEIDEDENGTFDLKEYFSASGKLQKSEEKDGKTKKLNITWFYDDTETAIRSEKDANGDGRTDTWFFYDTGRLTAVEEDANMDGAPDIWEAYDASETIVKREKDIDFDGKPDLVEYEATPEDGK